MNIEQKLELLKQAIEKGASIDVHFHCLKNSKEAAELMSIVPMDCEVNHHVSQDGSKHWYKAEIDQYGTFGVAAFYSKEETA
ncbi:hypothetical protein LRR81_08850 [Metabacillus sp. GX 13764]|uniref:hypothetical protein n=1 Tax=Metabacillus kandeliae TaxID=2900151 RepID=UPI001E49A6E2|nr:hypothetical protein [Metabacillus kandeliae]MCD7034342.1 hypothetical protein [Metabacillus kandeliae]